jgi:hypothetical protein
MRWREVLSKHLVLYTNMFEVDKVLYNMFGMFEVEYVFAWKLAQKTI